MNVDLVKKWLATEGIIDNLDKGETAGLARRVEYYATLWGTRNESYLISEKERIEAAIYAQQAELDKVKNSISSSRGQGMGIGIGREEEPIRD